MLRENAMDLIPKTGVSAVGCVPEAELNLGILNGS
jgi:hypothetical protein